MMSRLITLVLLLSFLMLSGCSIESFHRQGTILSPSLWNDVKSASYPYENQMIQLQNGIGSIVEASDSAKGVALLVRESPYAEGALVNPVTQEKLPYAAFILSTNDTGSGNFINLVIAGKKNGCYVPEALAFIGDRIVVKSIQFIDNEIVVDFLDHAGPMVQPPTQLVTSIFNWTGKTLIRASTITKN